MGRSFLLFFLSFLSFISVRARGPDLLAHNFENQEIIRNLDLRAHTEVQTTKYSIRNIADGKATAYIIAFAPRERGTISMVQGYSDNQMGDQLVTEEVTEIINKRNPPIGIAGTRFFQVDLAEPLEADESTDFHTVVVIMHALKPFPAELAQGESQHVVYTGDAYSYSLYPTITQRTVAALASQKIEFYTKNKARVDEDRIEYGPFNDIQPLELSPITIHYENNAPFATMKTMVKEIEISHWGNVAVEERYVLAHSGAKLKGGFSRYDFQQAEANRPNPSFRGIVAQLPAGATDIYYRDEIGNISTSHVRYENDYTIMEVEPRYPMFGGWKIDFYLGYNVPASNVLSYKKSSRSTYVLNMSFGCPFPLVVTDDLEVRVIFPEGASNIKWRTDIHVDSEDKDVRVTYLDTTGRPVLILRKADIVGIPPRYFQVTYSFSQLSMLQEPLLLIIAFLAFFGVSMVYVRIDLSLTSNKKFISKSRLINVFLARGTKMKAAYQVSDLFKGDAAMRDLRDTLSDIAQKKSRPLASKLEEVLDTIKKTKKKISPGTWKQFDILVKEIRKL